MVFKLDGKIRVDSPGRFKKNEEDVDEKADNLRQFPEQSASTEEGNRAA